MSHPSDISLGEIARRLDQILAALDGIPKTYLRQDLALEMRRNDQHTLALLEDQVRDLRADRDRDRELRTTDRRLIWSTLIAPFLVGAVLLALTIAGKIR